MMLKDMSFKGVFRILLIANFGLPVAGLFIIYIIGMIRLDILTDQGMIGLLNSGGVETHIAFTGMMFFVLIRLVITAYIISAVQASVIKIIAVRTRLGHLKIPSISDYVAMPH